MGQGPVSLAELRYEQNKTSNQNHGDLYRVKDEMRQLLRSVVNQLIAKTDPFLEAKQLRFEANHEMRCMEPNHIKFLSHQPSKSMKMTV